MSHFTTIKTQIKDIDALRAACKEMGFTLLQSAEARGYMNNMRKGDYVVKLHGPYDIAVNQQPDGTFGLTTDWWSGHVEKEVGKDYGKLLQLYGVHKASIEARKKGYSVMRQQKQDGSIKLVMMGVGDMNRTIEVIIGPTGEIKIDAIGFKGADCEKATQFLEQALGVVGQKVKKPEYNQTNRTNAKQKVGG